MTAGYSKTPLIDKLGLKPGMSVAILQAPRSFKASLGKIPLGVLIETSLGKERDFIHYFTVSKAELERLFPSFKRTLRSKGCLWISWPKGTAKKESDLNENSVRDIGLGNGLVDVKVCAIDDTWSGLKFVFRVKDRSVANKG